MAQATPRKRGVDVEIDETLLDTTSVSIVVPTYKESKNVTELTDRISETMDSYSHPYEIIIVDDDSGDGIMEVVEEQKENGIPIQLIVRKEDRGLSSAVIRGFREAEGDLLVCMDADLSHPPEVIPNLIEPLKSPQADFTIGSRYIDGASTGENWGFFRWLNSKIATLLGKLFTSVSDPMSGFFALENKTFQESDSLNPIGYKIGLELLVKSDCEDVSEVPIHFSNRKRGESKLSMKERFKFLYHLKRLADYRFGGVSQLIQFLAVGGSGMVLDLLCFSLFLSVFGLGIPSARGLAIWLAMTWNFSLNRTITFRERKDGHIPYQYGKYIVSNAAGSLLSWTTAVGLMTIFPRESIYLMGTAVVGIVAGSLVNFLLSRSWVFPSTNS